MNTTATDNAAAVPPPAHRRGEVTPGGEAITAMSDQRVALAWGSTIDPVTVMIDDGGAGEFALLDFAMQALARGHEPLGPALRVKLALPGARRLYAALGAALGEPGDRDGLAGAVALLRRITNAHTLPPARKGGPVRYWYTTAHDVAALADRITLWCATCTGDPNTPVASVVADAVTYTHVGLLQGAVRGHDARHHGGDPGARNLDDVPALHGGPAAAGRQSAED